MTGVWVGFDQPQTIISNGYAGELAVPIWAAFMKVATKGDKPDWFDARERRRRERLPRVGQAAERRLRSTCRSSTTTAIVESRSMIYTDYFVKGTQPTDDVPAAPARHRSPTRSPAFGAHSAPVHAGSARCCRPARARASTGSRDRDHGARRRPIRRPAARVERAEEEEARLLVAGLRRRQQGRAEGRRRRIRRTRSRMAVG